MKREFDVLVTDSRYKHALAAVRALGKEGLRVATCSEGFSPTSFSRFSKRSFSYNKKNFRDLLIKFIKENDVKLVLPIGYGTNRMCSEIKKEISEYSNIVVDDFSKMQIVSDKSKIIYLLKKENIVFPQTFVINKLDQIKNISEGKDWIIKSSFEETGKKVDYASSKKELKDIMEVRLKFGPQIVQERILGEGRGFFAFCDKGKILQSFQHRRIRQYPESGGVSSCAESIFDKDLENISVKFLKSIKWTGPVMLEFIYDENAKKYYFLEMNPKFWGSLDLSIFCGLNFPIIPFRLTREEEIRKEKYSVGKRFQWMLPEDILRIKTSKNKKSARRDLKKDFLNKRVGKDISYIFKDPLPTLIRLAATVVQYLLKWN